MKTMRTGVVMLIWLLISCNEVKDCDLVDSRDFAVIRFFRADTTVKTERSVAFEYIRESGGAFYSQTMDDTLKDDTISAIGLFVNPATNEASYVFETDSQTFELWMHYRKHLRIYYDECDPVYNFLLDSVSGTGFDSVVLLQPLLDRQIPTNVEIYL